MSIAFKKTCFVCGTKVDKLYSSMCENCFKEKNPPVKEIKPLNLKVCNMCKKIHYNNSFLESKELEDMLENIMSKKIILNKGYELKSVQIENFEILGHKILFDLEIECNLIKL